MTKSSSYQLSSCDNQQNKNRHEHILLSAHGIPSGVDVAFGAAASIILPCSQPAPLLVIRGSMAKCILAASINAVGCASGPIALLLLRQHQICSKFARRAIRMQPSKMHLGMCLSAVALTGKRIFPALKNASGLSRMLMQLWSVSRHQSTSDFWLWFRGLGLS